MVEKKVLITGGSGFIGGAIAKKLVSLGNEVLITGTQGESIPEGAKLLPLHLIGVDWSQLENIDICFHQAAINDTTFNDIEQMMLANYTSSKMLFQHLFKKGCKKFVYASSTAIYGNAKAPYFEDKTQPNPLNAYASSKLKLESFANDFGIKNNIDVVGLRYCNVYGPGEYHKGSRMSMIGQIGQSLLSGNGVPPLFEDGKQKRDWIYIDDVVDANIAASNFKGVNVFNCGFGEAVSFNELAHIIAERFHFSNIEIPYVKNPYAKAYQSHTECNMEKAKKLLSFEPKFDVVEGVNEYAKEGFLK